MKDGWLFLGDLDGSTFWGFLTTYDYDGYIVNLGYSMSDSIAIVDRLSQHSWLDQHTRAVFVEFSILNMNSNLFSKFTLVFEVPTYGGLFTWQRTETLKLYRYTGATGLLYLTLEMICFLFYFAVIFRTIRQCVQLRLAVFRDIGQMIQILAIVLAGCAFGLYVYRSLLTTKVVEKMKNNEGEKN